MFMQTTILAMLALSDADGSATDAERRKFKAFLNETEFGSKSNDVLTFSEAARRLGAKNPQFARRLAKCGRLRPVFGTASRPMGVTEESVRLYIDRGGAVEDGHFTNCASKDVQNEDTSSVPVRADSFSGQKVQSPGAPKRRRGRPRKTEQMPLQK